MPTYLLTWNPVATPWDGAREASEITNSGDRCAIEWSCGNNKSIVEGDRVFLLKQGKEPKGLVGSGWVASKKVISRKHWNQAQAAKGKNALYVRVEFDCILDPEAKPLLPVARAEDGPISKKVHWNTASSGIKIPEGVAEEVEELWEAHLRRSAAPVKSLIEAARAAVLALSGSDDDEDEFDEDEEIVPLQEDVRDELEESHLPKKVLRAILQRRGQKEFRMELLDAYAGRCCISGCDAEPALEAAHIIGYAQSKSQSTGNGLLLRSDIHTLFDLDLLRINPKTMRVVVDDRLQGTAYGELHGSRIQLPVRESDSVKVALCKRWEQTL